MISKVSRLARRSMSENRRPIDARLSRLGNQSSTLTDMQRLLAGGCIFRMAIYSVDSNVSRASSAHRIRRNSRGDLPVFEEMRVFGASATHFAQFP